MKVQELAKDEILFKMAMQNPKLAVAVIVASVVIAVVLGASLLIASNMKK